MVTRNEFQLTVSTTVLYGSSVWSRDLPSTYRRSVLSSLGAIAFGGIAGRTSAELNDPPASSLRFNYDHDVPHSITMRVTGVGPSPGIVPVTSRENRLFRRPRERSPRPRSSTPG